MEIGETTTGNDWRFEAACRQSDPELFYEADYERGPARKARIEAAKAVCGRCVVRQVCLQVAFDTQEPYGVWGGLDDRQRRAITRQRTTASVQHEKQAELLELGERVTKQELEQRAG